MPKPNTGIILSWICAPCGGCGGTDERRGIEGAKVGDVQGTVEVE